MKLNSHMQPVIETLRRRINLYFDDAEDNEDAGPHDPLLDVVRLHPDQAIGFIRVTMLFGILSAVIVGAACFLFLLVNWTSCGYCNRPLRWWLLVHTILQLAQVPVRVVFYARLHGETHVDRRVQGRVRRITRSPAWRTSKTVSIATYAWFILGVVWLLNSAYCASCPGLYRLSLAVVLASSLRLLITLGFFYVMFPLGVHGPEQSAPRAAPKNVIEGLRLTCCSAEQAEAGFSCAVCLSDFQLGEMLRPLPCEHVFHQSCIDKWLQRNGVCPLCMRDVASAKPMELKNKAS